ncbi:MAG: FHA domain-containing protein [Prochloraceae cyanobacterium]
MATVKCQNPHCDYFQKPVPEGNCCAFCGEPLGIINPPLPDRSQPNLEPTAPSFPSFNTPEIPSPNYDDRFRDDRTHIEPGSPINRAFFCLVHDSSNTEFPIYEKTPDRKFYIGRRGGKKVSQPEIDVTDIPYSERVSRPHAHIVWDSQADSYMYIDERSTNGSILNGKFLRPFQPYRLNNGDRLELGSEHKVIFTVQLNTR